MGIAEHIISRYGVMKSKRGTWEAHWQEVADLTFVNHASFIGKETEGQKKGYRAYDSTAIHAAEMLAAGLHGRLTNPASRWFELRFKEEKFRDNRTASIWVSDVMRIMYEEMENAKTAFTSHMNEMYLEYSSFGNGSLFISENMDKDGVLYQSISLSHSYFALNADSRVDTLYRYMTFSVAQLVSKFGIENVSKKVREKYVAKKFDEEVCVIHAVEPRILTKHKLRDSRLFLSIYIEEDGKKILRDSGFSSFPYATPRYYVAAGETYARGPGVTALPDVKMLNEMMKTTLKSAEKIVDPPVQMPDDGFINPLRTVPGGINYYQRGSLDRIEPLHTGGNVPLALEFMDEIRFRIRQIFFNDQMELGRRPEMTATEVVQRVEDMMRLMGPILGRMQAEALNTIINRTYEILLKQGKFPEAPASIDSQEIEIVYTSPIAKAQRQIEANGLQRVLEALDLFITTDPTILQRFDTDEILEAMLDLFSIRPEFLKERAAAQSDRDNQTEAVNQAQGVIDLKTATEANLNIAKAGEIRGAA